MHRPTVKRVSDKPIRRLGPTYFHLRMFCDETSVLGSNYVHDTSLNWQAVMIKSCPYALSF